MKLVKITWVDSCSRRDVAWLDIPEAKEWGADGAICYTVGYLVEKNKNGYVLAATTGDNNQVGSVWFIPHGCVREASYLTAGRPVRRRRRSRK